MFWIILLTILWLLGRDGSVSEGLRGGLDKQNHQLHVISGLVQKCLTKSILQNDPGETYITG